MGVLFDDPKPTRTEVQLSMLMARHPDRSVADVRMAYNLARSHTGRANALLQCGERCMSARGDLPALAAAHMKWERPSCRNVFYQIKELEGMTVRKPSRKILDCSLLPDFKNREFMPDQARELRRSIASFWGGVAACIPCAPKPVVGEALHPTLDHKAKADQARADQVKALVTKPMTGVTKTVPTSATMIGPKTKAETGRAVDEIETSLNRFQELASDQLLKAITPDVAAYEEMCAACNLRNAFLSPDRVLPVLHVSMSTAHVPPPAPCASGSLNPLRKLQVCTSTT